MTANNFLEDFNSHSKYLKAFAIKLTKDKSKADDLFQETALKAFKNQKQFQINTNMKAWLSTIMKNSFINFYRKNKRRNEVQDDSAEHYLINSSDRIIRNEGEMKMDFDEINSIIDELDDSFKKPFLMAYQGYKYDEIQKALGDLPMGTIKSKIHFARKMLREKINKRYCMS